MADAAHAAAAFEQFAIVRPDMGEESPFCWVILDNGFGSENSVNLVLFQRQGAYAPSCGRDTRPLAAYRP